MERKEFDQSEIFNSENSNYKNIGEYNSMFIAIVRNHCNDLYNIRGFLFLCEVYEKLGIPIIKDKFPKNLGWIMGENEMVIIDEYKLDAIHVDFLNLDKILD